MAIYRFSMTHRQRSHGSESGKKVAQYLLREAEYRPATDEVMYLTRTGEDTQEYEDLCWRDQGNLPIWAKDNPVAFFEAAYDHERYRGRYAVALQIALPRELTDEEHRALAKDFIAVYLEDKPYLIVKHNPIKGGQEQPHLHLLFSERKIDAYPRDEIQMFRRFNRAQPAKGGAEKERFWSERRALQEVRGAWATIVNSALERTGEEARIDPRSLRKQDIDRAPTQKWSTERVSRDTAGENRKASVAWEARKKYLGIGKINEVSRVDMVALLRREHTANRPGKATPHATPAERLAEITYIHQVQQREDARLSAFIARAEAFANRKPYPRKELDIAKLLRERTTHDAEVYGAGLRMRLDDESQGYGRGR